MEGNEPRSPVSLIRITYQDADAGEPSEVMLDPIVFVALVHVTRSASPAHAEALLTFAAALVKPDLTPLDHRRLQHVLVAVDHYIAQWADPAELALAISYEQLRTQQLTDTQAAMFAAVLLDTEVSAAVWRRRVDGWAEQQGLPAREPGVQEPLFAPDTFAEGQHPHSG